MARTSRHTYEPNYVQEFMIKESDNRANLNKCDDCHTRLGYFLE